MSTWQAGQVLLWGGALTRVSWAPEALLVQEMRLWTSWECPLPGVFPAPGLEQGPQPLVSHQSHQH